VTNTAGAIEHGLTPEPGTPASGLAGPGISVKRLGLSLGGNSILDNLNFTVQPGALHCIIGPNGGGKTSFLRSLLGQMPHDGRIEIAWRGPRRIGYVPQRLDMDPTLPISVANFIALSCQRRPAFLGVSPTLRPEMDSLFERLGLKGKEGRLVGQLSGGERQRLLFAQALLPRPSLLILDEPLSSVDRHGAELIQREVMALHAAGATILWVHHDLKLVKQVATHVTCINRSHRFTGSPATTLDGDKILEAFSR
jgi:zinc transport system ATP-binding protein